MEVQSTFDDVNLILRLYELRREAKLRAARQWFGSSFKAKNVDEMAALCPPGSEQDAYFRMVISYWEMAASFITSGVLNRELFFQSGGELLFVWEKVKDLVPQVREAYKNPAAYKNSNRGGEFIQWMNKRAPEAYAAFSDRIRGN